jgi:hypothetical protein
MPLHPQVGEESTPVTSELKWRVMLLEIMAVVIGLANVVLIVHQCFNAHTADLHAELTSGVFFVPPGISQEFEALRRLSDNADLAKNLDIEHDLNLMSHDPELIKSAKNSIVSNVSLYLNQRIPGRLPSPYSLLEGIWTGSIENTGDTTARAVTITIPYSKYFCEERRGAEAKCEVATDVFRVGDLQPQESVTVRAWTSAAPDRYWESQLHLSFMDGVGSVRILASASPFWRWMEQSWGITLWLTLSISWMVAAVVRFLRQAGRQSTKGTDRSRRAPSR